MRRIITLIISMAMAQLSLGQAAYITPNPTDGVEELTLYLDLSQSVDGTSNNALKALLEDNPDEPVYLWSWNPASPVNGNGDWANSIDENEMTKEAPLLYSFTFTAMEFYGVDPSILFQNGISCLAKWKDGAFYEDYGGEAKSEDFNVDVIPKLCDRAYCVFPEIGDADDFWTLTYDNTHETNPDFQNAGENDVYVFLRVKQDGFTTVQYVPEADVTSTPELQLKALDGEPGHFRLTVIPNDLFEGLIDEANGEIREIQYYILIANQPIPLPPNIQFYGTQPCD